MEGVRKSSDITGRKFGRITVLRFDHREHFDKGTRLFWLCRCDCGTTKVYWSSHLRKLKSCGLCPKPGGNRMEWPGYSSLKGALARCYNPNNRAYADYGRRGIVVCDRWRFGEGGKSGFECFFEDMGPRPEGLTLDRIDVDGDYEPGNCRWATKREQQQNQRRAIYASIGGVNVPLKKYASRTGLCYESVRFLVRKKNKSVSEAARGLLMRRAA